MGFKIAIFSLNQWSLDFTGNTKRIIKSIDLAHLGGAAYRAGPELELCGYSLEDAFYETDTVYHCWNCLLDILEYSSHLNMIIDIGMPVHNSALYNCRVIIYRGKILCIKAKTSLAREGLYREYRHFTAWRNETGVTAYKLPSYVTKRLQQDYVPFGSNFILEVAQNNSNSETVRIGWEICQELWDVRNVSSNLFQDFGCHLIINGSASYWELRKLNTVMDMIQGISLRGGACYAFSNSVGCDGQRYVFYGRSCIYDKGELVAMTPTSFDIFQEIQMVMHTIYPRDIDEYRSQMGIRPDIAVNAKRTWNLLSPAMEAFQVDSSYNRFYLNVDLPQSEKVINVIPNRSIRFEQEIDQYVSLWLWDYLRRSRMRGFMMPLSGGLDSSCVAVLVFSMCNHIHSNLGDAQVQEYFRLSHNIQPQDIYEKLKSPSSICKLILKCCYLSTQYSGKETETRAKLLSSAIGAEFLCLSINDIYTQFRGLLGVGSSNDVSLLDQNLQARLRMTATYYLSGGNRIVLATGNVDEAIMGYLTKYDCSSADINPIGGLCKDDLKSYLNYCCATRFVENKLLVEVVKEVIQAPPSAELTGSEQNDEEEIGITYDEISILGRVRRGFYASSGPKGAFETVWKNRNKEPFCSKVRCLKPSKEAKTNGDIATELAELIKRFYQRYARNRHKLTVLTPALHAETYSPDDNRYDHRHFLYAPWTEQFASIDTLVMQIKTQGNML